MRPFLPLLVFLSACTVEEAPPPEGPYQELVDAGVTRYLGTTTAIEESVEGDETTWTFAEAEGPQCLRGTPYRMATRDTGSEDLVIFLQGGGACWSDFCFAIETAPPGMPSLDLIRTDLPFNPVSGWNVTYLPYCDGSLFAGDARVDEDGDGEPDRIHAGLQNLSAALDVAKAQWPDPRRIVLAGSSGGGFGTIPAVVLVRELWPEHEILVMNDSGVGVAKQGQPWFLNQLFDEFNAGSFVPESCEGCLDDGHLAPVIDWELERDPKLRVAAFSSYEDYIISQLFLQLPEGEFRGSLLGQTGLLEAHHPDRYRRFLVEGTLHTVLIGNVEGVVGDLEGANDSIENFVTLGHMEEVALDGVTVADWLGAFVADDADGWRSRVE
jgi:hypothetical protein